MSCVGVLTEERYLNPREKNYYINNILTEDSLIIAELERLNISCSRIAWDSNPNLSSFKFILFRTTWNYFEKLNLFVEFLKKHKDSVTMINSYEQIMWNLDKKYLFELKSIGINIPKSMMIHQKSTTTLKSVLMKNKWKEVVIKPCVSAAAWNTYRVSVKEVVKFEPLFKSLVKKQDMLVQEFQKNIISTGEVSLIVIDGVFSHAVKKIAQPGDFRVQDDFGGTVHKYQPSEKEVSFALNVVNSIEGQPIYARVDCILDNNLELALSEVELIEPELWFRMGRASAKKLASAIKKRYF